MALQLNKHILRAAYDFMANTQPFYKWNLPEGEDVAFYVVRDPKRYAWYRRNGERHEIGISSTNVGHTLTLMEKMGHEMIHVHEEHAGFCQPNTEHSAAFRKLAREVCKFHGFDPKTFV